MENSLTLMAVSYCGEVEVLNIHMESLPMTQCLTCVDKLSLLTLFAKSF